MIAVIMGSDSDWGDMKEGCKLLKDFGISFDVRVLSAHRSPGELLKYVQSCGADVYICAAGKAAHLAGVVAANTIKPVIGVPIVSGIGGLDSLLSTVQMPPGVPVATVAIGGSVNAAILAVQILSLMNGDLAIQLKEYKDNQSNIVIQKDKRIQSLVENL